MLAAQRRWLIVKSVNFIILTLVVPSLYSAVLCTDTESYPDSWVPNDRELVRFPHSGTSMQRHFMTALHAECACVGLHSVTPTVTLTS